MTLTYQLHEPTGEVWAVAVNEASYRLYFAGPFIAGACLSETALLSYHYQEDAEREREHALNSLDWEPLAPSRYWNGEKAWLRVGE